jgi:hypothetical protein
MGNETTVAGKFVAGPFLNKFGGLTKPAQA